MDNPASFWDEARYQRRCAACGAEDRPFHAHHVVDRQELKRRGAPIFDPRNALRLCDDIERNRRCHLNFEYAGLPVALTALTDDNIAFAFEVLGDFAPDYLRERYTGEDERLSTAVL
jgi:hypothetical protein